MNKLFNVEDGQAFEGVKHDIAKAQGIDFVPDSNRLCKAELLDSKEVKSLFEKADKGSFLICGKQLKVSDVDGVKTIYEQLNKVLLPVAQFSDFEDFSEVCYLIKSAILSYPKDSISDALQKASAESHSIGTRQQLNDALDDDVIDKVVVDKNNELIEKADKVTPEYEEWLRRYREKRKKQNK